MTMLIQQIYQKLHTHQLQFEKIDRIVSSQGYKIEHLLEDQKKLFNVFAKYHTIHLLENHSKKLLLDVSCILGKEFSNFVDVLEKHHHTWRILTPQEIGTAQEKTQRMLEILKSPVSQVCIADQSVSRTFSDTDSEGSFPSSSHSCDCLGLDLILPHQDVESISYKMKLLNRLKHDQELECMNDLIEFYMKWKELFSLEEYLDWLDFRIATIELAQKYKLTSREIEDLFPVVERKERN